nr:enoyl-CoA hydratase-related protein [uncultured Rhodopila sp.]
MDLDSAVGTAKARELFFTGDIIGAEEALRIGLVNRMVEDAEPADVTMAPARRIAAMPLVAPG